MNKTPDLTEDTTSFEAVYLDPQQITFRIENDSLTLVMPDGVHYPRVTLRRCFPFSTSDVYVTVKTPDTEEERGIELGILTNIDKLDPESNQAISNELKLHYFVPVIMRIDAVREEYGFQYWKVLTDRGLKEFVLRDNIVSSARQISPQRWLLIDINQARYEINDDDHLDARSHKLLIRYLLL